MDFFNLDRKVLCRVVVFYVPVLPRLCKNQWLFAFEECDCLNALCRCWHNRIGWLIEKLLIDLQRRKSPRPKTSGFFIMSLQTVLVLLNWRLPSWTL